MTESLLSRIYTRNIHKELDRKVGSSECQQSCQEGYAEGSEVGNVNSSEGDENGSPGEVTAELCARDWWELGKKQGEEKGASTGWRVGKGDTCTEG